MTELLEPTESVALVQALDDPSPDLRIAALEALVRLPLAPAAWAPVTAHVTRVVARGGTGDERLAVIDASPAVPVRSVRALVARLAEEGEGEVRRRAAAAAAAVAAPPPPGGATSTPLRPEWAGGEPPGFVACTAADVGLAGEMVARVLDSQDGPPELPYTRLSRPAMARMADGGPAAAAVTLLLEMAGSQPDVLLADDVVRWVAELQGRFRPDLAGLSAAYRRLAAAEWDDQRRTSPDAALLPWFLSPGLERPRRWVGWQMAWTLSRGGLRALLAAVSQQLWTADAAGRLAAACLLADAASYAAEAEAPLFGRGSGPERPVRAVVVDDLPTAPTEPAPPRPVLDDDVQFSLYRPARVRPERWYPLLAFAHRTAAFEDPDAGPVDPVALVEQQAKTLLQDQPVPFGVVRADSDLPLARGTDLVFEPWLEAGEVNPARASVRWEEPVHRVEFRLRAPASAEGRRLAGGLRVFMGALLVGDVDFHVTVSSAAPVEGPAAEKIAVRRFRRIFASYSHADAQVVHAVAQYATAVGDQYLIDAQVLRSGERWERRLAELIEEADVFQLFWSRNAMRSRFVRQEWEHALALGREGFVRPVYWEEPLPQDEQAGLPPGPLLELHFSKLGRLPPSTEIVCPTCGFRNAGGTDFCGQCGAFLVWSEEKVARPAPSTVAVPSSRTPHPATNRPDRRDPGATVVPGDLVCRNCGEGNRPGRRFCRRCGESLADADTAAPSWTARAASSRWIVAVGLLAFVAAVVAMVIVAR